MILRRFQVGLLLAGLIVGTGWSRGIESPTAVVVIPARQRVVEFGFDLVRRQGVALVAFQSDPVDPLIHLWNGREWVQLTRAAYASGSFLLGAPRQVIVVGEEALLPEGFRTAPEWCRNLSRIRTLDIATLVNESGRLLKFSDRDWKWFAAKYDLSLRDLNAERRRWGKYGPPGQEWYRTNPPPAAVVAPQPSPMAPVKSETVVPVVTPVPSPERVIPDNAPIAPTPGTEPAVMAPAPAAPVESVSPPPPTVAPVVPPVPVAPAPVPAVPAPPAEVQAPAPAPAEAGVQPPLPVPPPLAAPAAAAPAAADILPPGATLELPAK